MAFHWWSVPLFAAASVGTCLLILWATRAVKPWSRRAVRVVVLMGLVLLTCFVWWASQGTENWIGDMLYNYSLTALLVLSILAAIYGIITGRSRRVSN